MEISLVASIAIVVGILAFTVLCVYLIILLSKVRSSLEIIQEDIHDISQNTLPVLENLKIITDDIKNMTNSLSDQVDIVRGSIELLEEMVNNVVEFEKSVQRQIEGPVMEAFSFIAALVKGVKTFLQKLKE